MKKVKVGGNMLCQKCGAEKQICKCSSADPSTVQNDPQNRLKKSKLQIIRDDIDHPLDGPHPTD